VINHIVTTFINGVAHTVKIVEEICYVCHSCNCNRGDYGESFEEISSEWNDIGFGIQSEEDQAESKSPTSNTVLDVEGDARALNCGMRLLPAGYYPLSATIVNNVDNETTHQILDCGLGENICLQMKVEHCRTTGGGQGG